MNKKRERLEILGKEGKPLIGSLAKITPNQPNISREELLPAHNKPIAPTIEKDTLLDSTRPTVLDKPNKLLPEASPRYTVHERKHKLYLARLADAEG